LHALFPPLESKPFFSSGLMGLLPFSASLVTEIPISLDPLPPPLDLFSFLKRAGLMLHQDGSSCCFFLQFLTTPLPRLSFLSLTSSSGGVREYISFLFGRYPLFPLFAPRAHGATTGAFLFLVRVIKKKFSFCRRHFRPDSSLELFFFRAPSFL